MAATGEFTSDTTKNRPCTSDSDVRYIWAPDKSQARGGHGLLNNDHDSYLEDEDFKFSFEKDNDEDNRPGMAVVPLNLAIFLPNSQTKTLAKFSRVYSIQNLRTMLLYIS